MTSVGIIQRLKQSKDPCVLKQLQKYLRFSAKLAEARTKLRFLERCMGDKQFPKHFWKILRRNRINPSANALMRHTLNECDTIRENVQELERKQSQCVVALDSLSIQEFSEFNSYINMVMAQRTEAIEKKLNSQLSEQSPKMKFPANPERYVHNFSSLNLDNTLLEVLSLGPKFCCPKRKTNLLELEVQFEYLSDQLAELVPSSDANVEELKSTLVNACYKYYNCKPNCKELLTKEHFEALKRLQENQDILLSKPDKGAGIVIMNKADYIDKMTELLSDTTKFKLMEYERDRTQAIEKSISRGLRRMKQAGILTVLPSSV